MYFNTFKKLVFTAAITAVIGCGAAQIGSIHAASAAATDPCAGGATAICKDGSKSYSKGHRGACSRHGGVAKWCH